MIFRWLILPFSFPSTVACANFAKPPTFCSKVGIFPPDLPIVPLRMESIFPLEGATLHILIANDVMQTTKEDGDHSWNATQCDH